MRSQTALDEEHIYTDAFVAENSWNGRERNQLLLNRGDGTFLEAGSAFGLASYEDGRGLAAADFDLDGDVDFVINNYKAQAQVFENRVGQGRAWLAVRLQGTRGNRDAVGAQVSARAGDLRQLRVVGVGHGYASQYSLEQLFGLGDREQVDEVHVSWPGGLEEVFGPFPARQRVRLVEGRGRRAARPRPAAAVTAEAAPAAPGRETPPHLLALILALVGVVGCVGLHATAGRQGR